MQDQLVFTATEARQNFFNILRMVEGGKKPIVINRERKIKFMITQIKPKKKEKNIEKILEEMSKINIKTLPIKKMKKIFESRYESNLFRH